MAPAPRPIAVHPSALKPGELVGQYGILEKLGEGGMGCVYKVKRGEGVYVLKILTSCFLDDAVVSDDQREYRLRADREFFAIRSLDHANVLRAYAFERWPELHRGWPYIVTEFVDGLDVCGWREEAQPSLRRICAVLAKVADALAHVHREGLFHRDLKAPNILVRREGEEPVLIDLGIARHVALEPVTACAETIGTSTHFAPEYVEHLDSPAHAQREPFTWTVQVDLYAFGYVAYELLTGRPPILCCGGEHELLSAIKNDPVPDARGVNEAIPDPLAALVMRLLEKDPAARPESAGEVRDAFYDFIANGGPELDAVFAVPAPPPGAARRTARRIPAFLPTWMRHEMAGGVAAAERVRGEAAMRGVEGDAPGEPHGPEGPECAEAVDRLAVTGPAVDLDESKVSARGPAPDRSAQGDGDRPVKKTSGITSAIRKARERLAVHNPRSLLSRRVLLGGGGVVAAALILFVMSSSSGKPAKDDMLSRLEREQAAARRDAGARANPVAMSAIPFPAPRLSTPEAPPLTGSDAKDIDAALAARYGRPSVPLGGLPSGSPGGTPSTLPERPVRGATIDGRDAVTPNGGKAVRLATIDDPLVHAEVLNASSALATSDAGPRKLGIPMGTHIRAKLLSNLDSRTIGAGPVEAVLALPFVLRGAVVLPARTLLYGKASEANGRFNIQFTQLRLPDDIEVGFEGLALDRGDNKPGLAASARIAPADGSQEDGLGTKIARGTGNVLLNTMTGGVPQDVARSAGSAVVNNRSAGTASGSSAILLDSGVLFDVFVARSF
jgi:hypothetical protein